MWCLICCRYCRIRGALSSVGLDLPDPFLSYVSDSEIAVERDVRASTDRNLLLLFVSFRFGLTLEPLLMAFAAAVAVIRNPPDFLCRPAFVDDLLPN
jgi:hypothetical protein